LRGLSADCVNGGGEGMGIEMGCEKTVASIKT